MTIGFLRITIHLHGIGSLKEKRRIVKSRLGRLKSRFNFSVAAIGAHDSKAQAIIGLAVVANEGNFVNKQLDTVINFVNGDGRFYVGQIEREMFSHNG